MSWSRCTTWPASSSHIASRTPRSTTFCTVCDENSLFAPRVLSWNLVNVGTQRFSSGQVWVTGHYIISHVVRTTHSRYIILLCPAPMVWGIKRWCASDVCLYVVYIGPKSKTERHILKLCLCLLLVVLVLSFCSWFWSCKQRSWSCLVTLVLVLRIWSCLHH